MDIIEVLKLQELEIKRSKLKNKLKNIERNRLDLELKVKKNIEKLNVVKEKIDSKHKDIENLRDFITYKEKLISELEMKKKYSTSRKNFKDTIRLISKYEDEIIKTKTEVSNLEVDTDVMEKEYIKLKSELDPKLAELKHGIAKNENEASNLRKLLLNVKGEIEKQKAKVPKDLFNLYESLKGKFNGLVFADISSGSCEGCGMTYSINELRNLMENIKLCKTKCPYCGRFIYNKGKNPPY